MFRQIILSLVILCTIPIQTKAETQNIVEIYDIGQEQVIKRIKLNEIIQIDVTELLEGIDGIFKKVRPIPDDGLIIKVPLEPHLIVENEWINDLIEEVLIFYSEDDYPYLLIFDQENSSHFFTFNGDSLSFLLKVLNEMYASK